MTVASAGGRVAKGKLQEGIYFRPGKRPAKFYALVLLGATRGAAAEDVTHTLRKLGAMYAELKRGVVADLQIGRSTDADPVTVPAGRLQVLFGFGPRWFRLDGHYRSAPTALRAKQFRQPVRGGGGAICEDAGIYFDKTVRRNPAKDAVVAVQLTADTPLAVERGVVETWKLLYDGGSAAALRIIASFTGSQRDDGRSWLDFHDGLSNLPSAARKPVIVIRKPPEGSPGAATWGPSSWTEGGTYMAFVRLGIDLGAWRDLGRDRSGRASPRRRVRAQERLVGRSKLSGCPLTDGLRAAPGCPAVPDAVLARDSPFRTAGPFPIGSPRSVLNLSHIRRANQPEKSLHENLKGGAISKFPIFRQGYQFLETLDRPPGFLAGLNFVSFQQDPEYLIGILTTPTWLEQTNFGGPAGEGLTLLRAYAAGMFLVPPTVANEQFPGEHVLCRR